nr:RNA polymerase beta subunit protein a [Chlorosarcina stigmatica]
MPIHRYFLSDFIEIQRKSFFELLQKGLIEEFSKRNPITNSKKTLELFFYPEYFQLTPPEYNPREAILKSKSYSARLYIPVQLTDKKLKIIKLKWVYMGNIPLMTKRGHFVLNGAPRVIVNQILRSPGIYYQKKIYENYISKWSQKPESTYKRYYADLICERGTWLRLEIDKNKQIWAQTKKGPKIPIFWLLIAMGLPEKIIFKSMVDPARLLANIEQYDEEDPDKIVYSYVKNPPEAWKQIAFLINSKKPKEKINMSELGRKWIFNKFMNPRTYDLGKQGRLNFNKKLGLSISNYQTTLTPQDLLGAVDYLLKVEKGIKKVDDIDHLKNRRVRTSGELLQIQIGTGLIRLEKTIREKINVVAGFHNLQNQYSFLNTGFSAAKSNFSSAKKRDALIAPTVNNINQTKSIINTKSYLNPGFDTKYINQTWTIHNFINTKALNGALREFFGSSPLSQFMDQINPLAELTHKRRLTSMGPGGVTRDSATLAIRGIHPTHYGRICPIETPEGKNTGLVNSLTAYSRVNGQGFIETPFYKVYKGQVQKRTGMYFFSAEQEEKIRLAASDLPISDLGFLPKFNIPVRIAEDFTKTNRNKVEYIGVSPIQMISIATSLIPFLEHDDANRALMGSNMQRQAVPLIRPERPIVGTGLEGRAVSDSGHVMQAKFSGFVAYASSTKIIVYSLKNL